MAKKQTDVIKIPVKEFRYEACRIIPQKEYSITEQPFYRPIENEVDDALAAYLDGKSVLLLGPTGTGKNRLVEYLNWRANKLLREQGDKTVIPLYKLVGNEDILTSELVSRGSLQKAVEEGILESCVREGGIFYFDEIFQARDELRTIVHEVTDNRGRMLSDPRQELVFRPGRTFGFFAAGNPMYLGPDQAMNRATMDRFFTIWMNYPPEPAEIEIVLKEGQVNEEIASALVKLAGETRKLKGSYGLREGASTRALVEAAQLYAQGMPLPRAVKGRIINTLTHDQGDLAKIQKALRDDSLKVPPIIFGEGNGQK
ncbi:CbbQ/NirQ/NorQ C-terminal domain-containing protein [Candidatus Woesearchaeota archaeon]|nr:CbbQ/NirQ/NorQ C-terminal domain-containing protein [Candidatus Woesearchaeota archaeon]